MTQEQIREAQPDDAGCIASLVNAAYRPTSGITGWTHESALILGPRIDTAQILDAMRQPDSVILVLSRPAGLAACIQIQKFESVCALGLLAVDPQQQCDGLGARILSRAEHFAVEVYGCATIRLLVLSQRQELKSYYLRRGYRATGIVSEYPRAAGIGTPAVEGLIVESLEKQSADPEHTGR